MSPQVDHPKGPIADPGMQHAVRRHNKARMHPLRSTGSEESCAERAATEVYRSERAFALMHTEPWLKVLQHNSAAPTARGAVAVDPWPGVIPPCPYRASVNRRPHAAALGGRRSQLWGWCWVEAGAAAVGGAPGWGVAEVTVGGTARPGVTSAASWWSCIPAG